MSMRIAAIALLVACNAPRSSFEMTLGGDVSEQVGTSASATGSVDNAGNLTIDDTAWNLSMALPGLAPAEGVATPTTLERVQPALTLTGSCKVWLASHASTNGSRIDATFTCDALASPDGTTHVSVAGGALHTHIDDAANDPSSCIAPVCP